MAQQQKGIRQDVGRRPPHADILDQAEEVAAGRMGEEIPGQRQLTRRPRRVRRDIVYGVVPAPRISSNEIESDIHRSPAGNAIVYHVRSVAFDPSGRSESGFLCPKIAQYLTAGTTIVNNEGIGSMDRADPDHAGRGHGVADHKNGGVRAKGVSMTVVAEKSTIATTTTTP